MASKLKEKRVGGSIYKVCAHVCVLKFPYRQPIQPSASNLIDGLIKFFFFPSWPRFCLCICANACVCVCECTTVETVSERKEEQVLCVHSSVTKWE